MDHLKCHELDGLIRFEELAPDYPCVIVTNEHASAKVALHGAHVIDFTPTGEKPIIFTSKEAIYKEGKAIRGGVPVCWPWFSAHPNDSSQPSHGIARNAYWQLFRSFNDADGTTLIFTFSKDHLHAELTVEIGKELTLSVKTINTGDSAEIVGGALHTYFSVSDISEIHISGLEDTSFHDSLTGLSGKDSEAITFNAEFDRVYLDTKETVILSDKHWKRDIQIEKSGSKSTVVWNPWIEKSASMSDLGDDEYKEFVCIETANALEDVYRLSPGGAHTMTAKISVVSH